MSDTDTIESGEEMVEDTDDIEAEEEIQTRMKNGIGTMVTVITRNVKVSENPNRNQTHGRCNS